MSLQLSKIQGRYEGRQSGSSGRLEFRDFNLRDNTQMAADVKHQCVELFDLVHVSL